MIANNIRSAHNLGSILRSADGFGAAKVFCAGYTPYPMQPEDSRLPHLSSKITSQIHKTALGAEKTVTTLHVNNVQALLTDLKDQGYLIVALEQHSKSVPLNQLKPTQKVALLLGEEIEGIDQQLLNLCDIIAEIPMRGQKESFNVSVAAGIALYELRRSR